jgi:hypothetical protein
MLVCYVMTFHIHFRSLPSRFFRGLAWMDGKCLEVSSCDNLPMFTKKTLLCHKTWFTLTVNQVVSKFN